MTAKKDEKVQPGKAGAVALTKQELSEKELEGVVGGTTLAGLETAGEDQQMLKNTSGTPGGSREPTGRT